MPTTRRVRFDVLCTEPSSWSVSLERVGTEIEIGLHYSGSYLPTHEALIDVEEFKRIVAELTE